MVAGARQKFRPRLHRLGRLAVSSGRRRIGGSGIHGVGRAKIGGMDLGTLALLEKL